MTWPGSAVRVTTLGVAALATATGCGLGGTEAPSAEVGECLNMAIVEQGQVSEIPTVDCGEKHDGQVVHTFEMEGDDFPSEQEWSSAIDEGCTEGFEDFVGASYAESELLVRDLSPTRDSWDAGDRQVLCLAFLFDGTTSESFEGAEV